MKLADTTADARRIHREVLIQRTPEERVQMAVQMSEEIRGITCDGIRHKHPDWTSDEVRWELLRRLHGDELISAAQRSMGDA